MNCSAYHSNDQPANKPIEQQTVLFVCLWATEWHRSPPLRPIMADRLKAGLSGSSATSSISNRSLQTGFLNESPSALGMGLDYSYFSALLNDFACCQQNNLMTLLSVSIYCITIIELGLLVACGEFERVLNARHITKIMAAAIWIKCAKSNCRSIDNTILTVIAGIADGVNLWPVMSFKY